MSAATEAIEVIDSIESETGMSRSTAKALIDYVDKQQGDLVTKQDIKDMATKQDLEKMATKQDVELLKRDVTWTKAVMMAGFAFLTAVMVGGFGLLAMQISNTNDRLVKLEEHSTDMAERLVRLEERSADMTERLVRIEQLLERDRP